MMEMGSRVVQSIVVRTALRMCGVVAVALGAIGVVVPGMPTTVFVLLASYCFARSCPSWDRWLHERPWLGAGLRRFRQTGGMSRTAKTAAIVSMWTGLALSLYVLRESDGAARPAMIAGGAIGSAMVLFCLRTVDADRRRDRPHDLNRSAMR